MSEWKPGDVVVITEGANRGQVGLAGVGCVYLPYPSEGGGHAAVAYGRNEARRVVVIDAEDREQVERLCDLMWARGLLGTGAGIGKSAPAAEVTEAQAALREFANPRPRIEEPQGLGAVVEDDGHRKWIRHSNTPGSFPWICEGVGARGWSEIDAVRVLSEGVAP